MEEWFTTGACDGFVLAATHFPGAFEDVVRMVIPELRRRGRTFARSTPGQPCAIISGSAGCRRTDAGVPEGGHAAR